MNTTQTCTAFEGHEILARGAMRDVVTFLKERLGGAAHGPILILSDDTGKALDVNFRGSLSEVLECLANLTSHDATPREVTLLPRHWEWLASQPGEASATLRRLIDEARKRPAVEVVARQAQERVHRMMAALAGDRENYEEALRALYRRDQDAFVQRIATWPHDLGVYLREMAEPVFATERGEA